jgi:hypothetical protein
VLAVDIVARCHAQKWRRIAFIGATKNAGKTTALNAFVRDANAAGQTVGLCSVGVDGERQDAILGTAKPAIDAPVGTCVVSAEQALEQSHAVLEWLESFPISSPLGTIALTRVTVPGTVLLAGIRERAHLQIVLPRMEMEGVHFSLIDGAFDRIAAASPDLVDAAVLVIGAAAGRTLPEVVQRAYALIQRFRLPQLAASLREVMDSAVRQGVTGFLSPDGLSLQSANQALFGLTGTPGWSEQVTGVYLPGALTDSVVRDLLSHSRPLDIVVAHPAQVLLSADAFARLYRAGHRVSVWASLPLAGIAVNPTGPAGNTLPRQALMDAVQEIAGDTTVYDALAEEAAE